MISFLFPYPYASLNVMRIINFTSILLFIFIITYCLFYKKSEFRTNIFDNKKLHYFMLLVVIAVGAFLRLYKLDVYPLTTAPDETSAMYDALCILNYGTNRWGHINPVYTDTWSFAGQSPAMAYFMAFFMNIFGETIFAMRLGQAIPAIVTLGIMYMIVLKISDNITALLATAVLSVSPWHIMLSRWSLDCNLSAFFTAATVCALLYSFNKKWEMNNVFYLFCIFAGLSLYSYALTCISIFVLVVTFYAYIFIKKKINWKIFIPANIVLGLIALPMIWFVGVMLDILPPIYTNWITIPAVAFSRNNEIGFSFYNNVIKTILTMFSTDRGYLAARIPEMNLFYNLSVIPLIWGFILFIKKMFIKNNINYAIINCWFLGSLVVFFVVEGGSTRDVNMWIILPVFIAFGLSYIIKRVKLSMLLIPLIYGASLFMFTYTYFFVIQEDLAVKISHTQQDAIHYAQQEIKADTIYMTGFNGTSDAFIFSAFDNKHSPSEYQKKIKFDYSKTPRVIIGYDNLVFYQDIYNIALNVKDNKNNAFILFNYYDNVSYFENLGYSVKVFRNFSVAYID